MAVTIMRGSEFKRDVSKAKRQARHGPVVITSRGRATHVLLAIDAYMGLTGRDASIADLLAMPEAADIEFDPPRPHTGLYRPADLS